MKQFLRYCLGKPSKAEQRYWALTDELLRLQDKTIALQDQNIEELNAIAHNLETIEEIKKAHEQRTQRL